MTSVDNLTVVLKKKDELVLEQTEIPTPKENEVLLAMNKVGICGSDVHYWKRGHIGDFIVTGPLILGHESAGTVLKVGSGVTNLKPGDRVAIEPGVPCRKCDYCKTGIYNLCPDVEFCATPPVHGTLRRYYTHAADFCFKLPDHVSLEEGAMLEPLSVAVYASRRANVKFGSKVLICGAGPIGLITSLTVKALGASQVMITDIVESRLEFAKKLGVDFTLQATSKDAKKLAEEVVQKFGCHPDITIECSGAETSIQLGILATKPGGVCTLVGIGPNFVNAPLVSASTREVDIRGVLRYANCYPTALELVSTGKVNLKPLITHNFNLADALKAFETAHTGEGNAIKVMIHCDK